MTIAFVLERPKKYGANIIDQDGLMREILKNTDYPKRSISSVFYFIDYLLQLPEDLTKRLYSNISPILQKEARSMLFSEKYAESPTLAEAFAIERKEAEEKGKQEGKLEVLRSLAVTLINKNYADEEIIELTNLSVEEVGALRKK